MKILIQTQLSNYNSAGKFILECDSGWQMVMGRARVLLDLDPTLSITVMSPPIDQCVTSPYTLNSDLLTKYNGRLNLLHHIILPNALATRYDFNFEVLGNAIKAYSSIPFDVVYINDPMLLRNFQALFYLTLKYKPKFVTHSHFIDNPSCPKFPVEASLWQGQVEAARKSDYNFWQCESALNIFLDEVSKEYKQHIVDEIRSKSAPWDDGYSSEEINSPINMKNVRINVNDFEKQTKDKIVLFVPNRIGDGKRSSDYTGCGHFLFNILPHLRLIRNDFVVVCGNPNQKILNDELEQTCGPYGYIKVVPDSLNRDEYKWIAKRSHVVVSLYDQDSYGSTANRECIDLGLKPLMLDNYEYASIGYLAKYDSWLIKRDFSDIIEKTSKLISNIQQDDINLINSFSNLQTIVRNRCSYEQTTSDILCLLKNVIKD